MPDASRRTVRPILGGFWLPYNGADSYRLESITAAELVLVMSAGTGNLDPGPRGDRLTAARTAANMRLPRRPGEVIRCA
jgi:hypothetical protein